MTTILLENISIYAYHGFLKEENIIGSYYLLDVELSLDISKASISDNLEHTVNYAEVNSVIHEEMAIKSSLLEHVSNRIIDRILKDFDLVEKVKLKLSKMNPPMGGEVEKVSIVNEKKR